MIKDTLNSKKSINKNIRAAMIGNALETYDASLYTFFAVVLGPLFFPFHDPALLKLISYAALGAGFIGRPLGALFFSHIGDRLGRKKAMTWSIFIITIPTFIIGILPSYAYLGIWTSIILIGCRLVQGFCIGGESGGTITFIMEHAPAHQRGYYASFAASSTYIGAILGTLLGIVFFQPIMPPWAWRIPFLLGGILGLSGYYIRKSLEESQEFINLQQIQDFLAYPVLDIIRHHKINVLRAFGVAAGVLAPFYMTTTYFNGILKLDLGFSSTTIMTFNLGLLCIWFILSSVMGRLADHFGIIRFMKSAILSLILLSPFLFFVLHAPYSSFKILCAQVLISILNVAFAAPCAAYLSSLFPTKERFSGISLGYTLGSAVLGGTTPIIAESLSRLTHNPKMPLYYLIVCLGITYFSLSHKKF